MFPRLTELAEKIEGAKWADSAYRQGLNFALRGRVKTEAIGRREFVISISSWILMEQLIYTLMCKHLIETRKSNGSKIAITTKTSYNKVAAVTSIK